MLVYRHETYQKQQAANVSQVRNWPNSAPVRPSSSRAAQAQTRGLNLLNSLRNTSRRSATPMTHISALNPQATLEAPLNSHEPCTSLSTSPLTITTSSPEELATIEAEHVRIVNREILKYEEDGILDIEKGVDLVRFWDVRDITGSHIIPCCI